MRKVQKNREYNFHWRLAQLKDVPLRERNSLDENQSGLLYNYQQLKDILNLDFHFHISYTVIF